jgi:hypothetical protein
MSAFIGLAAWFGITPAARAQAAGGAPADIRATGRQLAKESASAILTVRLVISHKIGYEGQQSQEGERKNEISGTVISPDGLTMVPLSEIDPSEMFRRMRSDGDKVSCETRVKDLKLILDKKTEIPATVVLRDPDLDLAFLRPIDKPKEPMKYIDLAKNTTPELLQQVCVLARMGKVADQEIGVMTGEIQAIVSKPRTFYVPSAELASGGFGVPIFAADGTVVGVVLMRTLPGAAAQESGGDALAIILPAADIKEIADQAPEKGAAEPEPASAAEPAAGDGETPGSASGESPADSE